MKSNFSLFIEYHLTDKCNLNCKGCMHFSNLVKENNSKDIDYVKNDFDKIFHITEKGKYIRILSLMGGEPLLNKNIIEILNYLGNLFKNSDTFIMLTTNGILIKKMSDEFFDTLRDNNILLRISPYPTGIDYKDLYIFLEKKNVNFTNRQLKIDKSDDKDEYGRINRSVNKLWQTKYLKTDFDENYEETHKCCPMLNLTSLRDGKLYSCSMIAYFDYFDEEFKGQHPFKITDDDIIDLDKINSIEELYEAKQKIPPFCGYCRGINKYYEDWGTTNRDIKEWIYK